MVRRFGRLALLRAFWLARRQVPLFQTGKGLEFEFGSSNANDLFVVPGTGFLHQTAAFPAAAMGGYRPAHGFSRATAGTMITPVGRDTGACSQVRCSALRDRPEKGSYAGQIRGSEQESRLYRTCAEEREVSRAEPKG